METTNACCMKKGHKEFWRAPNQNCGAFWPFIFPLKMNYKDHCVWLLKRMSTCLINYSVLPLT